MNFGFRRCALALITALATAWLPPAAAQAGSPKIGVVVMHGKGGSPARYVTKLALSLEEQGFLVANLEMPWSGRRNYDVDTATAEKEIEAALQAMRDKGAQKLFVAGHSHGGIFAVYFGSRHAIDGVIAIAPGGNVASQAYRKEVAGSLELARKLVAEGKGGDKERFSDFEGSKGTYMVVSPAAAYLSWFDPDGAMNFVSSLRKMKASVPVLYVAPTGDYGGLRGVRMQMFNLLPKNPNTRMFEPDASHLEAPTASIKEIAEWTTAVAKAP